MCMHTCSTVCFLASSVFTVMAITLAILLDLWTQVVLIRVLFFIFFWFPIGYLNVSNFWKFSIDFFCVCIFSYFWTYVWLYVFFLSLYSFLTRFLLITSTMTNTKITFIITDFTIIIWLIAKFLLENYNIKLTCFYNAFTFYLTSIPNNDITHRVVMFP